MHRDWLRLGLLPGLALLPLTLLRAWLELRHPDVGFKPLVSVLVLSVLVLLALAIHLGRRVAPWRSALATLTAFVLAVRLPIAVSYGLAVGRQWTTPAGDPVRYVTDVRDQLPWLAEPTGWSVLAVTATIPTLMHVVVAMLVYAVARKLRGRVQTQATAPAGSQ